MWGFGTTVNESDIGKGQMKRILIVDDDPSVRDVLGEIVTTYGYEALASGSAKGAVATLAKGGIHLIFLDISMPDVEGDRLLDFLRKKGFKTPVVVVSAHIEDDVRERLLANGVSGIIEKPFEVSDVIDEMERALTGK